MKQFKLLACLFITLFCFSYTSCSDDDPTFNEEQLIGVWEATRVEGYQYIDGEKVDVLRNFSSGDILLDFFENGRGEEWNEEESEYFDFSWAIKDGNQLVISYDEDNMAATTIKIAALNETTAILEKSGKNDNGKFYLKLTFKRRD